MKNSEKEQSFRKFSLDKPTAQKVFDRYGFGAVEAFTRFDQGMINDVYSINSSYVLKVNSAHPDQLKLAREAAVYEALSRYEIPVPTLYGHEERNDCLEYPYILMSKLQGESLSESWKELSVESREKVLFAMGRLLGSVHHINSHQLSFGDEMSSSNLRENICSRLVNIVMELRSSKVLDDDVIDRIEEYYRTSSLFDGDFVPSLLHGNYVFGNIVVTHDKIQGIVDWEWARFGNAEEELANVLYRGPGPTSLIGVMDEELLVKFKEGYLSVHPVSLLFERRFLSYALLYFLKVLPNVPTWTHKPEKQKEYRDEATSLMQRIGLIE